MRFFNYDISIKKRSSTNLRNPANWWLSLFGSQTRSGIVVNEQKALNLSAFWQGVRAISETIAYLPIGLHEIETNGNKKRLRLHPSDILVSKRPSSFHTSYYFRQTMQAIATVRGNSYALIIRDGVARPLELRILNPLTVTPFMSKNDLFYRIGERQTVVHHLDIIHIKGVNILSQIYNDRENMGMVGENPVMTGRESLSVGLAAQNYEGSTMGNAGFMDGFLTMDGKIDPDDRRAVEDSWQRRFGGADKAGKTPLLGGGMKYERMTLTPQESMLMETRKFSVEEVSRWLNIPQHKLGHLDRASFNNIEQLARDFYTQTIRPWAENWEQELAMKLLTEEEKESGRYEFRFDFFDLLRGDSKTLAEVIRILSNVGIISINDGRRMMGMNQINEEWANINWVQLNLAPADKRPEPKPMKETKEKEELNFSTNGQDN